MNVPRKPSAYLLGFLALASTAGATGTGSDDFEGGVNDAGWSFRVTVPDVLETAGGNPGGWLHNPGVDSFAPMLANTLPGSCFDGDYRARGVNAISVDAQTISANFGAPGFEFSLLLRDTKGTPSVNDDDYAYFVGPEVPQPGAGWKSFLFPVPSASTAATPPGWSGGWAGDCCAFRPGVDWNDVIQSVDVVEFWWLNPSFFAIFQSWDVGADNVRLHVDSGAVVRNGAGSNPTGFTSTSAPLIGNNWTSSVDVSAPGVAASVLVVGAQPASGTFLNGNIHGEVLILPPFYVTDVSLSGLHVLPVPADCNLLGRTVFAQAATFMPGSIALNNAIDVTFGTL